MYQKEIVDLAKILYSFYPIGMPQLSYYPGLDEMRKLVGLKVDSLLDSRSKRYEELVVDLRNSLSGVQIIDHGYFQFPSFKLEIEVESIKYGDTEVKKSLLLVISLLFPGYTCFMQETHTRFFTHDRFVPFTRNHVLYGESALGVESTCIYKQLLKKASLHFEDYQFFNHKLLFSFKVHGGIPYGVVNLIAENNYPIYSFLFDGFFDLKNASILD